MKSVERHKLETNWLATHLNQWIEKIEPHSSKITGIAIAIVVLAAAVWYFSGASAAKQREAWTAFNGVVGGQMDRESVSELAKSAAEFEDTEMYPWARVTWADGQVWIASQTILQNRTAAMKDLTDAASAYQSVIDTSGEEPLVDRARFGLARVYEMRNEVEKAREEYLKVKGSFATLAKRRAEALQEERTKKSLAWLANAEAPRPLSPRGPGMPGQRPLLDVDDLKLPGAPGTIDPTKSFNIDELLKDIGNMGKDAGTPGTSTERYPIGDATKSAEPGAGGDNKEAKDDGKSAEMPKGAGETPKSASETPKNTTEKAK